MKEIFSAFGSEIFRPLVTIVIPGAMAISVWFVVALQKFTQLRAIAESNHTETTLVLVLCSVAAGLLIEDIGSRIESRYLDKRLGAQPAFSAHSEEWNQYLRLVFKTEPVGQRYLRAILLRFKFELGTAIALLSSGLGLLLTTLTLCKALTWSVVLIAVSAYLVFVEARSSHRLLSKIRHEILKGALPYPAESSVDQQQGPRALA
jgi:hypothetical protein